MWRSRKEKINFRCRWLRGTVGRWFAVALGVALVMGQLKFPVYAQENPVILEIQEVDGDAGEQDGDPGTEDNSAPEQDGEEKAPDPDGDSLVEDDEDGDVLTEKESEGEEEGETGTEILEEENAVEVDGGGAPRETPVVTVFLVDGLDYIIIDAEERLVKVRNSSRTVSGELKIPGKVTNIYDGQEYTVTEIDEYGFAWCSLTSVEIEDGVTKINDSAFKQCSDLTTVVLPNTLTEIGNEVFYECEKLKNLSIPKGVTSIGDFALYACTVLEDVVIPEGITYIGRNAFAGCHNLKEVVLPESITEIGSQAFGACWNLESINIPNGITEIPQLLFFRCKKLAEIKIPAGVEKIGRMAFRGCSSLSEIIVPESVSVIEYSAIEECSNLSKVVLLNDAVDVDARSFYWCNSLTRLEIAVKVTGPSEERIVTPVQLRNPADAFGRYEGAEERKLVFLTADGTKPLTGSDLATAIDAYDKVTDYDEQEGDGKWYGWNLPKVEFYTLNASADEHGRIDPSGSVTVAGGDEQIFTMIPDEGYRIKSVTVDGNDATWEEAVQTLADDDQVQTGKSGTYTFSNVQADHTIEVFFEMDNGSSGSNNTGGGNSGDNGTDGQSDSDTASAAGATETIADDGVGVEISTDAEVTAAVSDTPASAKTASEKEPRTDDASHVEIYATIAMIAGFTYLLLYFMEERRGMSEREKEVFVAAFIRWAKKGGKFRRCCALVAIFCILFYYHSVGKRIEGQVCPAQN